MKVQCKLCGKWLEHVGGWHVLKVHGMSSDGYLKRFSDAPLMSEVYKERMLVTTIHSKQARKKTGMVLRKQWEFMDEGRKKVIIEARAAGERKAIVRHSKSMKEYWATKSEEERKEHYTKSFGSEEAGIKRGEVSKRTWASYTPEQKLARLNSSVQSQQGRLNRKKHWDSLTDEEKNDWVKVHLRSRPCPSEPEISVTSYLDKYYHGEWQYNGNRKEGVKFGGKTPDHINVNGKKELIEVLGNFWHSEKRTGRTPKQEMDYLTRHYAKYGFKCYFIWGDDCGTEESIDKVLGSVLSSGRN